MQDHLFSKRHIDALRNHIDNIKKMTDDGAPERAADAEKAPSLVGTSYDPASPPPPPPAIYPHIVFIRSPEPPTSS
ncbi:hypothetical protein HPB48_001245 [Haemaphysalis longicornis]|uniref:Uncharacterized protein n=1 Tax=Haemaphysalis longicornis TaxID=44386 RepID=A0A9J6FHY2_HAELO|nr:hypothetical protein HPB48_001245 [Haemaphysalis longicornis]